MNNPLQIGTLAVWLTAASVGSLGLTMPWPKSAPAIKEVVPIEAEMIQVETVTVPEEAEAVEAAAEESAPAEETMPEEALPEPPPAPVIKESEPLPELPPEAEPESEPEPEPKKEDIVIPKPKVKPRPVIPPKPIEKPRPPVPPVPRPVQPPLPPAPPVARPPAPAAVKNARPAITAPKTIAQGSGGGNGTSKKPGSAGVTGGTSDKPVTGTLSFGVGEGRQPAPNYPADAKRARQEGTVVVKMLVDTNGSVQSASAASPCAWAALNSSAVSTVRSRWKFKSGPVRIYRVAITFRLR